MTDHKSIRKDRCTFSSIERSFAEKWEKLNTPVPGVNHGFGVLDALFVEFAESWPFEPVLREKLSPKEKMIAATVVQWLGSNCGMAFLIDVLNSCGYEVRKKRIRSDKQRLDAVASRMNTNDEPG